MRSILFILMVTGCATAPQAPQVEPAVAVTPAATCGMAEPAPIEIKVEIKKPAKNALLDREFCR